MIKAIIIDDEERARNSLNILIKEYLKEVDVVANCTNVPEGVLAINKFRPDLVFLDIEMPEYNGFELLGFFREVDFEIIFVTAYSEYAIKAFEVSALDYLMKPVSIEMLQAAVEKAKQKKNQHNLQQRLEVLKDAFSGDDIKRIAVPTSEGMIFLELADIMMLEADGSYTKISLKNKDKMLISKKLRFFEDLLMDRVSFYRSHRSFLVNVNFIRKYSKGESLLVMDNEEIVPVARDKKQDFENMLRERKLSL